MANKFLSWLKNFGLTLLKLTPAAEAVASDVGTIFPIAAPAISLGETILNTALQGVQSAEIAAASGASMTSAQKFQTAAGIVVPTVFSTIAAAGHTVPNAAQLQGTLGNLINDIVSVLNSIAVPTTIPTSATPAA